LLDETSTKGTTGCKSRNFSPAAQQDQVSLTSLFLLSDILEGGKNLKKLLEKQREIMKRMDWNSKK
jgi:hypothetical protein